jgi:hypothetical protein
MRSTEICPRKVMDDECYPSSGTACLADPPRFRMGMREAAALTVEQLDRDGLRRSLPVTLDSRAFATQSYPAFSRLGSKWGFCVVGCFEPRWSIWTVPPV